MSRPFKRPRLHFLGSVSPDPDGELAIARARNDGLLKTRWENIFERYEKDFEGIGDEISMLEDQIVVDNGHIKSMQNARDTGSSPANVRQPKSAVGYDGRCLLRAMTVAPSEDSDQSSHDSDAEEVLQSIETIADNIIASDESSDDELFDPGPVCSVIPEQVPFSATTADIYEGVEIKTESEDDFLFDTRPVLRSPSVDDLFDTGTFVEPFTENVANERRHPVSEMSDVGSHSIPPQETLNRDIIREEVRKALEQESRALEAKIEPAWRIPIRLPSARASDRSRNLQHQSLRREFSSMSNGRSEPEGHGSVWQPPPRPRRSRRAAAAERNIMRLRAESEDPLQDGFTSETEEPYAKTSNAAGLSRSKSVQSSEDEISDDNVMLSKGSSQTLRTAQIHKSRSAAVDREEEQGVAEDLTLFDWQRTSNQRTLARQFFSSPVVEDLSATR